MIVKYSSKIKHYSQTFFVKAHVSLEHDICLRVLLLCGVSSELHISTESTKSYNSARV